MADTFVSMVDNITSMGDIFRIVIKYVIAVLLFSAEIWLFLKLLRLRKMSKLFLASSKRENFEGGLDLVRMVGRVFSVVMLADIAAVFFVPLYGVVYYVQIAAALGLICFSIPVWKIAFKAKKLYMHLYPPLLKTEVYKKPDDFDVKRENSSDSFFEAAEMAEEQHTSNVPIDNFFGKSPNKTPEQEDLGEIIEYDDEGYKGAWRLEKSKAEAETEEGERKSEEQAELRECPFCGTLNGINSKVCDFCGADILN